MFIEKTTTTEPPIFLRIMSVLGMTEGSGFAQSEADTKFDAVMDSLVDFRSAVREFALSAPASSASASAAAEADSSTSSAAEVKKKRKEMRKERQPLLAACDSLREGLAAQGLQIVDQTKDRPDLKSSWKTTELNVAWKREKT